MSKDRRQKEIGMGFDLGTTNSSITVIRNGKVTFLKSPLDGDQVPSVVYYDEQDNAIVGTEAIQRAYKNPKRLFAHMKRGMYAHADEPWHNGPTPVELMAELIKYLVQILLKAFPDLKGFPQFGGNTRDAEDLGIILTCPANYGIQQHDSLRTAAEQAGLEIDGFVGEPEAGARRILHEHGRRIQDGDLIVVVDVGGGTFDCIVLRFQRGVLHTAVGASGDGELGGITFTADVAEFICEQLGYKFNFFDPASGLNLGASGIREAHRKVITSIWLAADEAKHKLSVTDRATVCVQTQKGLKDVDVTLDEMLQRWEGNFQRCEDCAANILGESGLSWADVEHVILIGGSSMLPTLQSRIARATERDEADVLVSTDSAHVVSQGAAENASFQEETDQALQSGMGLRMRSADRSAYVNRFFMGTGHIVPAGGQHVEKAGQIVRSPGGECVFELAPVIAKPGVHVPDPDGTEALLSDAEVVHLRPIRMDVDLPPGEHPVRVGFSIDPNRAVHCILTLEQFPNVEPFLIPLAMRADGDQEFAEPPESDVILMCDCSGSMSGEKMGKCQAATIKFINQMATNNNAVCLLPFWGEEAEECVPFTTDYERLIECVREFEAGGGTPMAKVLDRADDEFLARMSGADCIGVLFTDGYPNYAKAALQAATVLKERARLFCVGIGEDAGRALLEEMASSPSDYFYAETPDDFFGCMQAIAELILTADDDDDVPSYASVTA